MEFMYTINGGNRALIESVNIDKTSIVYKGQAVKMSSGKVNLGVGPSYIGVAAEDHTGEADAFNPRQNGESLNVIASPGAVFSAEPPQITGAAGSDTKTAVFSGTSSFEDNEVAGGYLICLKKAADSTNTDAIGDIRKISGYSKVLGKFILNEAGVICAGDVYALIPPIGFNKLKLSDDLKNVALNTAAGDFIVAGKNLQSKKVYVLIKTHIFNV